MFVLLCSCFDEDTGRWYVAGAVSVHLQWTDYKTEEKKVQKRRIYKWMKRYEFKGQRQDLDQTDGSDLLRRRGGESGLGLGQHRAAQ